jgi:hypothetical protein
MIAITIFISVASQLPAARFVGGGFASRKQAPCQNQSGAGDWRRQQGSPWKLEAVKTESGRFVSLADWICSLVKQLHKY